MAGLVASCAPDDAPTVAAPAISSVTVLPPSRPVPLDPFLLARLPTYDHSMQAVHPDLLHVPQGWHGWEYWMAFTPFPGGATSFENPSVAVSHNGVNWQVPEGGANPLVPRPSTGYNSDPDLSLDEATGELVLIYRTVTGGHNRISEMRSSDGVHWSTPKALFLRRNHGMVSPALVLSPTGGARLWYVDAGPTSCQHRTTRVMTQEASSPATLRHPLMERGWSAPRQTGLVQPGYNIWHLDVTWVSQRSEYWAVYSAYPGTDCMTQELFFARSSDGVKWSSYAIPFVAHGELPWSAESMYRASVLYDERRDVITFYTSARTKGQAWRIGLVEYRLPTFLTALSLGTPAPRDAAGAGPGTTGDIEP